MVLGGKEEFLFRFLGRKDSGWKQKSCFCETEGDEREKIEKNQGALERRSKRNRGSFRERRRFF